MPTLHRTGRLKVQMYAGDHRPPHFHLVTPDCDAMIALDDLRVIEGTYRQRELATAREWAGANRELLKAEWERLNG